MYVLQGILTLLLFQFIGECLVKFFELKIPGALIGMLLLLLFLIVRKSSFHALNVSVFLLLRYLPLFMIPAATGIMTQFETIANEALAIVVALVVGTFIALGVSAKLMDLFILKKEQYNEQ